MSTIAFIQARMGSTRLPGKVMLEAAGKTFLEHMVERTLRARTLDQVMIVTSSLEQDDPIADLAATIGVGVFRGSETDVLDRYYRAAKSAGAEMVVRLPADCPLIDPDIIDRVAGFALAHRGEFALVTNRHPLTYPDGMDVDAMEFQWLEHAAEHAREPGQREHVIPYFWESGQAVRNVECNPNLFHGYRWTVDYPEDARLVATIFERLYRPAGSVFSMRDILNLLQSEPSLNDINRQYLPAEPPPSDDAPSTAELGAITTVTFRPATASDAERLYEWRNDPHTRAASIHTGEIPWHDHVDWLTHRLSNGNPDIYIADVDAKPIGTFRFDGAELSYTIAPEHRGKGLGSAMLNMIRDQFGSKTTRVKSGNMASAIAAERAGHHVEIIDD